MQYKPVKRIITVEFVKGTPGGEYEIRITPEQLVVRYRDTVVWDVQGLPAALAKKVQFGAFLPLEVPPRIRSRRGALAPLRLRALPKQSVPVKAVGTRLLATLDLGRTDVGIHKYDVEFDGRTLRDPEIEIRGPRN